MKQSRRIELCKQYHKHPLRKEYERKKAIICKRKPFSYYLMLFLAFVSVVMFFVYGYLFFELLLSNIVILIIVLGIINIFVGFGLIVFGSDERKKIVVDYNKKALKALEDEYKQKGLVEMDIQELYKHECCEYDYDNNPICCVTKRMLSYKEYCFCKTPGNCRNCEAFKSALFD